MKMLCLPVLGLLFLPALSAQDLSRYRSFSLGMNLATTLKQTGQELHDVNVIYERPGLIQEVSCWPQSTSVNARRLGSAEEMLFSFFNGELYKISVTYDRRAVEGLTDEDMVKFISAVYGPPTAVTPRAAPAPDERFDMKQRLIASWTGPQYSIQLLRNPVAHGMELLLFSQHVNAQAEAAIIETEKLEAQELPQKQADQRKKEADDLELARQKNKKAFEP